MQLAVHDSEADLGKEVGVGEESETKDVPL
jgi:hypothetical protein